MEFFKIVKANTTEEQLNQFLIWDNLEKISNQLFPIGETRERTASVGSVWGEFTLRRDPIRGGLRFALEECPNALTWTVTTGFPPAPEAIVIHLTINRKEKDPEFIEEIEDFLKDHGACLEDFFEKMTEGLSKTNA